MEKKPFEVVYEDNHLIAVNKASGVLVQPDEGGDEALEALVKQYIKEKYNKPGNVFCGVIHRIDRPVSGLVLFARTTKALQRMNEIFRERDVTKTYWALVKERPPEESGTLVHWLLKDREKNVVHAYTRQTKDSQVAELSYRVIGRHKYFLLEIDLYTGRPHQIRVQMAKVGCPIVGDIKYGYKEKTQDGRIYLHSRKMSFVHPVKLTPLTIEAPVPREPVWGEYGKLG